MMTVDVDGEETTEREYAAMAEGLGKKLKNALSGGKGPLLKIPQGARIRDVVGRALVSAFHPSLEQRLNLNLPSLCDAGRLRRAQQGRTGRRRRRNQ